MHFFFLEKFQMPCGHNSCRKCFTKWVIRKRKGNCAKCRQPGPPAIMDNPRPNLCLVAVSKEVKLAKLAKSGSGSSSSASANPHSTGRARRAGLANLSSSDNNVSFVNVPSDYFGPILPEHDLKNGEGVRVGSRWKKRMECRKWGVHLPPLTPVAGQARHGVQSVVLTGNMRKDDLDDGEWFLFTGRFALAKLQN